MGHRTAYLALALCALMAAAGCGTRRSVLEPVPRDAVPRPPAPRTYLSSRPLRHGNPLSGIWPTAAACAET